jgi:hypothetical protein
MRLVQVFFHHLVMLFSSAISIYTSLFHFFAFMNLQSPDISLVCSFLIEPMNKRCLVYYKLLLYTSRRSVQVFVRCDVAKNNAACCLMLWLWLWQMNLPQNKQQLYQNIACTNNAELFPLHKVNYRDGMIVPYRRATMGSCAKMGSNAFCTTHYINEVSVNCKRHIYAFHRILYYV